MLVIGLENTFPSRYPHSWNHSTSKREPENAILRDHGDFNSTSTEFRVEYITEANIRSVLARFSDNNWEKGTDFVKICHFKKLVWEKKGSASARWMTDAFGI